MAKRNERNRYQGYRGRGKSLFLKVVIILLAILLLAGVIFVIFFMGEYMEYTENGPQFRPPWVQEESAPPLIPSDPVVVDDPIVVDTDPPAPSEPAPVRLPAPDPVQVIELTPEQFSGGMAAQMAGAAGANAVLVEMKAPSGRLAWRSGAALAAYMRVNAGDDSVSGAVRTLAAERDLYLIARIQCFRDHALSRSEAGGLPNGSGGVWTDGEGFGWANPASGTAADYLAALCRELADMGFDEIVLACSGYPAGAAALPDWGDDRTLPVAALYAKAEAALGSTGVRLSVQTDEDTVRSGSGGGITTALLARYAQRVWLPAPQWDDTDYAALLTAAGMRDAGARVVVAGDGGWSTPRAQRRQ